VLGRLRKNQTKKKLLLLLLLAVISSTPTEVSEITLPTKGENKSTHKKINKHGYNNYIPANVLFLSLFPTFTYVPPSSFIASFFNSTSSCMVLFLLIKIFNRILVAKLKGICRCNNLRRRLSMEMYLEGGTCLPI